MRIFSVSDLHIDYPPNLHWLEQLSRKDYQDDLLILAGDISDSPKLLSRCFNTVVQCFKAVTYVPGNHDLWIIRDGNQFPDSWAKFSFIQQLANDCGVLMEPITLGSLSVIPLLGWYDYSFGQPSDQLSDVWMDYRACQWPDNQDDVDITSIFIQMNEKFISFRNDKVISFSHFLPRIDLMPSFIPLSKRYLYPVLGTSLLEKQIRLFKSDIHIYGHSHVNQNITLSDTLYINNAFGYPNESMITAKKLKLITTI